MRYSSPMEFMVCLEEAIQELSPRQREVLLLTVQGYAQGEVAVKVGISQAAVSELLRSGRDFLIKSALRECMRVGT